MYKVPTVTIPRSTPGYDIKRSTKPEGETTKHAKPDVKTTKQANSDDEAKKPGKQVDETKTPLEADEKTKKHVGYHDDQETKEADQLGRKIYKNATLLLKYTTVKFYKISI